MATKSKVLRVPINTWYENRYNTELKSFPFYDSRRYCEIARPNDTKYDVGDIVVIDDDGDICIGVVMGVIDNVCQELRTNACGMVSFDNIRHATMNDIKSHRDISGVLKYLG